MQERFIMITEEGAFLARYLTTKQVAGKCYACAYYKSCNKDHAGACSNLSGCYYFVTPILNSENMRVNPADVDFSGKRVKYQGKVMDKCGLSRLIHDTEYMLRNDGWPLTTDIYWDTMLYDELKRRLKANIYTLDILIKYNP